MYLIFFYILLTNETFASGFVATPYECMSTNGSYYMVNDLQSAYKEALLGKTIFASSALPTFEE